MNLGHVASCLLIATYIRYIWALRKEMPNPFSIAMWMALTIINTATYADFTSTTARIFAYTQLVCMSITTVIAGTKFWRYGWQRVRQLTKLHWSDGFVITLFLTALVVKPVFGSSIMANWVVQAASVLAFIPVFRQSFTGPEPMNPWPWFLASCAYIAQFGAAWPDGIAALVFPIIGLSCHFTVFIGTRRPRTSIVS